MQPQTFDDAHLAPPPTFDQAKNLRQKARAAGMHPDYWYPVARVEEVTSKAPLEVTFWKRPIVLYRQKDGAIRALAGRCLHRQLRLVHGRIIDDNLVCPYHGWAYDRAGRVAGLHGENISRRAPSCRLHAYPVRERYGMVWVFPGQPDRVNDHVIPEIPELYGKSPWPYALIDMRVNGHHSLVLENVCDFTHAYLHRRFKPFWDAKLTRLERIEDRVELSYDTKVGGGGFYQHLVSRGGIDTNHIELAYEYPYQRSNTGDAIKHWLFVLPEDERTTRVFFLFYFKSVQIPGLKRSFPKRLMQPIVSTVSKMVFQPLLGEDAFAVEEEQEGYERHFDAPPIELNPAVREFQKLTEEKWSAYLEERGSPPKKKAAS